MATRTVTLLAAALGVKPEAFREAFSDVSPARGRSPIGDEAPKNAAALMQATPPHGVPNDHRGNVSNHDHHQPQCGDILPKTSTVGHAIVENIRIKRIVITSPGLRYCSAPDVKRDGYAQVTFKSTLKFDTHFKKNGANSAIEVVTQRPVPTRRTPAFGRTDTHASLRLSNTRANCVWLGPPR